VAWMRNAPNPQRRRSDPQLCGTVNLRAGHPYLAAGYAQDDDQPCAHRDRAGIFAAYTSLRIPRFHPAFGVCSMCVAVAWSSR
jgi:hypothetical protein